MQTVPESYITRLLEVCGKNSYNEIESYVEDVLFEAYSATQLIEQLNEAIISDFRLADKKKAHIFDKLSVSFII